MRLLRTLSFAIVFAVACPASAQVTASGNDYSDAAYRQVLEKYVDADGKVDYAGLKADSVPLDTFLNQVAALSSETYDAWNEQEKVAFWLNAYNAITLKAVIEQYPIESIRDIPRVWKDRRWTVMSELMSLDDIEHETLRRVFDEPRIHMALVCASGGCPPLRNEAYRAEALDRQLDAQMRAFLSQPQYFRVDRENNVVYLSKIFQWYGRDFDKGFDETNKFAGQSALERAVLSALYAFLAPDDQQYLDQADFQVKYLEYDWNLNEQKPRQ